MIRYVLGFLPLLFGSCSSIADRDVFRDIIPIIEKEVVGVPYYGTTPRLDIEQEGNDLDTTSVMYRDSCVLFCDKKIRLHDHFDSDRDAVSAIPLDIRDSVKERLVIKMYMDSTENELFQDDDSDLVVSEDSCFSVNTCAYVLMSRPVFNSDMNYGLIYSIIYCGPKCGQISYYFIKKDVFGHWFIDEQVAFGVF